MNTEKRNPNQSNNREQNKLKEGNWQQKKNPSPQEEDESGVQKEQFPGKDNRQESEACSVPQKRNNTENQKGRGEGQNQVPKDDSEDFDDADEMEDETEDLTQEINNRYKEFQNSEEPGSDEEKQKLRRERKEYESNEEQ